MNKFRLSIRLALGFFVVLCLVAVIAVTGWIRFEATQVEMAASTAIRDRAVVASQWKSLTQLNVNRTLAIAKSAGHKDVKAYFDPLIKQTSAQISTLQKTLETAAESAPEKAHFADIAKKRKLYVTTRDSVFGLLDIEDPGAKEALESKLLPEAQIYIDAINAYEKYQIQAAMEAATSTDAKIEAAQWTLIGFAVLCLLVGGMCAWLITRSVTQPLSSAVIAAHTIAHGDLSQQILYDGRDEVGDVLDGLRTIQHSLGALVMQVRENAESVASASAQIAQGSMDLAGRTAAQASALEATAASMQQLGTTVDQNAETAHKANQLARGASDVAAKGGEVVGQVVETMKGINDSSKRIADIIGVIDGIAFQTNILALNAAVEAARAGEQGRGFAVVAGEVRSLAQRSAAAAQEIKGLISSSVERVGQGATLVDRAGTTMSEVVSAIRDATGLMGAISTASAEQSAGVAKVYQAITDMDQSTQQNAALVEENAAATDGLQHQARQLLATVGTFRLASAAGR